MFENKRYKKLITRKQKMSTNRLKILFEIAFFKGLKIVNNIPQKLPIETHDIKT